ncbi:ABC transporter permease [Paenibacillus cymbidii]|uniref:ABC transporter permease n=1 Tax=Paenibacillus cymbidii TaxID=1639034 RepID=UPI001081A727|nr:ABC transporter permease subunit [Paenibacillus cymbidii]
MRTLLNEWRHFRKHQELFWLTLPGIAYKLIFAYLPMFGIIVAFKNYRFDKGILGSDWVGFANFRYFFVSDIAWRITRNTVLYGVSYFVIGTVCAVAFAIMLNEVRRRWIKVYQTSMFLPYFLSWVLVSYIVYAFLDHGNGLLNRTIAQFGGEEIKWYQEAGVWPYILNIVQLWKGIGFSTLIYYAAIVGIDTEYYEAARIDGASKLQMARHITVPLLTPMVVILMIMAIGNLFRGDFGLHYFIPNNSGFTYPATDIIDTYVYRALRDLGDIGMSAAVGLYQSVVGFVLIIGANYAIRKINADHSLW